METSSPEQIRKNVKDHATLAGVIALCTIVSSAVAVFVDLPPPINFIVALGIAIVQALIVGYFLMHLKTETPLIYRVLLLTGVFLMAMIILSGLALRNGIPKVI